MRYLILTLVLFVFIQPASAALKRCVDDEGKSHYYNKILPPECADKASVEMNKQGVVMSRIEAKQAEHSKEDNAAQIAAAQKLEEVKRRDTVLLSTYTSEEEIDLARERNVQPVELTIIGVKKRLEISKTRLRTLLKQANQAAQTESPTLEGIKKEIIPAQRDAQNLQKEMKENLSRIERIKSQFNMDKKRFVELMAQERL